MTDRGSVDPVTASVCRVPLVEAPAAGAQDVFDELRTKGQPIPNLYRALANAPSLLRPWVDFAWPLRRACESPRALRELAIAYLASRRGSAYVHRHHVRFARDHGVTAAQIDELRDSDWRRSSLFSKQERTVLELVDDVVSSGAASAHCVDSLLEQVGTQQTVELIITVAFFEAVCVVNRSLGVPLELEEVPT